MYIHIHTHTYTHTRTHTHTYTRTHIHIHTRIHIHILITRVPIPPPLTETLIMNGDVPSFSYYNLPPRKSHFLKMLRKFIIFRSYFLFNFHYAFDIHFKSFKPNRLVRKPVDINKSFIQQQQKVLHSTRELPLHKSKNHILGIYIG